MNRVFTATPTGITPRVPRQRRHACQFNCRAQPCQSASEGQLVQNAQVSLSRRNALLAASTVSWWATSGVQEAKAGFVQDLLKANLRPELKPAQAVALMMDAQSTLRELKALAATSDDSEERFHARKLLPGMAKRLRDVGQAAPIIATLITGKQREELVSELYGGAGGEVSITDPVYTAIGKVITISGRTIRKEAQASPALAEQALDVFDKFLSEVPQQVLQDASNVRASRTV